MIAETLIAVLVLILVALIAGAAVLASYRWGVLKLRAVIIGVGVLFAAAVAVLLQAAGGPPTRLRAGVLYWTVVPLFGLAPPVIATLITVSVCARLRAPRWLAFALTTAACLGGIGAGFVAAVLSFIALAGEGP